MTVADSHRLSPVAACVLAAAVTILALATSAQAQIRPVRVEGHWDPATADKVLLGTLELRDERGKIRTFGVIDAQAYLGVDKGMAIFRHSQPRPLQLRGKAEMVESFVAEAAGRPLMLFGTYDARNDSITITKVESGTVDLGTNDLPDASRETK